jgi:hypothetical protein
MLSHGWTYQALVSDCLSLSLNRVTIPTSDTQSQKRSYDLDSKDFFWARNAANPFPQVAEEIDADLNKYKSDAAEITRSTGVSDVNDISQLYDAFIVLLISEHVLMLRLLAGTCRQMLPI